MKRIPRKWATFSVFIIKTKQGLVVVI